MKFKDNDNLAVDENLESKKKNVDLKKENHGKELLFWECKRADLRIKWRNNIILKKI